MRTLLGLIRKACSGLQFRLVLLLLLACAPLVALTLHTAWEDRRRAQSGWRQRARLIQQIARREDQTVVDSTRQLLLAVSESAEVRSLSPRRAKRSLTDFCNEVGRYSNMGLLWTNGDVLASVYPMELTNMAGRRFFERALEHRAFAVDNFPIAKSNEAPAIRFGHPLLDTVGQVMGIVFAELDLEAFSRRSEIPSRMPKEALWLEVDRKGTILAQYPRGQRWIGRTLSDPWLLTNVLNQVTGLVEGPNPQGVLSTYYITSIHSRLGSGEVALILGTRRHNLFADADRALERNLTWLALAVCLALALGWMGSKLLILRPVNALVRTSTRLAAGDLSARTGLKPSDDEVGRLTRAFDQMAQALEDRELERQRSSQKLSLLSHRLVEVQESERRHIARELHDEIGQSLTAAEMNLQAALKASGSPARDRRLEAGIQAVERVLEQVHDLSLNLRPSMLDDLGLEPALRWYVNRQAAVSGLRAEFSAEPLAERLDPMLETECFRVAQEAVTNVVRHAKARAVRVQLFQDNGHLHLRVQDNGVGFNVGASRERAVQGASLGLLSMEERTSLVGGGLKLTSAPGEGTEVHAWFPLSPNESPSQVLLHE